MNSTTDTAPNNMGALERLLDQAGNEHAVIAETMRAAVTICQTRHAAHGGIRFQLQAALASIRSGHPEDATAYIERAIDIQARWAGDVTR
jgi:hypothetical protein